MRLAAAYISLVVAAALQLAWFGHVRPLGVMPNLVLVLIVLYSLWLNASPALGAAVLGGLMLDFASGSDFGLRIAFFLTVSLAVVAARQIGLQADSALTGLLLVALASILYDLAVLATIHFPLNAVALGRIGAGCVDAVIIASIIYIVKANLGGGSPQKVALERRLWR